MRFGLLLAAAALAVPVAAHANIYQYAFSITGISNGATNFDLTIDTPGLISTTGLTALSTPLATTLGYNVNYFGENASGWYAFTNAGGLLYDTGLILSPPLSFSFMPYPATSGYDSVGTFSGSVSGDSPASFSAHGALTITDLTTSPAPEPSTLLLFGTGTLGIAAGLRRRFA